jgi:hypothetical protein
MQVLGKYFFTNARYDAGQVHAHHLHPIPSRQFGQVRLQRRIATAEHHIKYRVPLQIAQSGRIAVFTRKEMLINPHNARARGTLQLRYLPLQKIH